MKVKVVLHAVLKDLIPGGRGDVEVTDGALVNHLLDHLGIEVQLRELVTVNGSQVDPSETVLSDGDEVQVFPAVAGGSPSPFLDEGLRLFDEGKYFLAHETLEEHWIEAPEMERDFYQGLIHLAVGFHHSGRGNQKGARLQFKKAATKLAKYPDLYDGVDIGALKKFLAAAPDRIEAGDTLAAPKFH